VLGGSSSVVFANASGTLQLNTCKPLILYEVLNSIRLISDAQRVLASGCIRGLQANQENLRRAVDRSPVIGTILVPIVGYDVAARLIKEAAVSGLPVRDLVLRDGKVDVPYFDRHLSEVLDADTLGSPLADRQLGTADGKI